MNMTKKKKRQAWKSGGLYALQIVLVREENLNNRILLLMAITIDTSITDLPSTIIKQFEYDSVIQTDNSFINK